MPSDTFGGLPPFSAVIFNAEDSRCRVVLCRRRCRLVLSGLPRPPPPLLPPTALLASSKQSPALARLQREARALCGHVAAALRDHRRAKRDHRAFVAQPFCLGRNCCTSADHSTTIWSASRPAARWSGGALAHTREQRAVKLILGVRPARRRGRIRCAGVTRARGPPLPGPRAGGWCCCARSARWSCR